MKKTVLALGLLMTIAGASYAQGKKKSSDVKKSEVTTAAVSLPGQKTETAPPAATLSPDNMAFNTESHDFGTIPEGPAAEHTFTFKNTGKEPILIQKVQPACGCTAADWTKEPILPGKTGMVKASYGTQGRPSAFTKTVTVLSNAGAKVLTLKGEVEKAPTTSVPENTSMIKTN